MIRDTLHLKAPGNWINDPNGFICYRGIYHLFYQHFPYAPQWGTMHWGHAVSEDLVHWEHLGVAVFPTKSYDRNGIFSGSALEVDGDLYLYYSAVRYLEEEEEDIHHAKNGHFETSQALIISGDGCHFDNFGQKRQVIPVIRDRKVGDAVNTRDPKVWKSGDWYYMVLGSTWKGESGKAVFFKSGDAIHWEYAGQYQHPAFGTILECPDLFQVGADYVFIGSSIHLMGEGLKYSDASICFPAEFQEGSCRLELPDKYQMVDYGGDLYAPQTNLDKEGRRVLAAWMRMPKAVESEDRGIWNGMMCLPRVVESAGGHIYFRVHPETDQFFSRGLEACSQMDMRKPFRLKTALEEGEGLDIGGYRITVKEGRVTADRSEVFAGLDGYRLVNRTPALGSRIQLDIFVEPNLIEIFVNDGEYVLSNVVYGLKHEISGFTGRIFTGG